MDSAFEGEWTRWQHLALLKEVLVRNLDGAVLFSDRVTRYRFPTGKKVQVSKDKATLLLTNKKLYIFGAPNDLQTKAAVKAKARLPVMVLKRDMPERHIHSPAA